MIEEFPAMIGKYKVLGVIAKGGMGVVYKAIHPSLKRYVVIKKLTAKGHAGDAERFKKEAQILLDLQSPYIVHLFDYFTEGSYRYMVEELVDGIALDKLIQKETYLPPPVAMLFMQEACYALKCAHSKEIVHRDIKPGNILISKRGEIKLADFGIASDNVEHDGDGITKSGVALGTPAYMPPEQFEDSAKVDYRADIYALGIMLYEMVTGTKPFPGTFSMETLKVIKKGKYIPPRKIDKHIPEEIEILIHRMVRPKAKHRIQTIDGVLHAVKKYLRHYDTHELRVHVARAVASPDYYKFPHFIPKDKKRRIIRKTIFGVVLFAALVFGAWKTGLIHRYLLRKWYTPVTVQMEMPKSLYSNMDLPIRAFFYENDGKDIPEVKNARRVFSVKGSRVFDNLFGMSSSIESVRLTSRNKTYDTTYVYLKKGNYRVKVVVGPYVWWKSFSVGSEKVIIEADFLKNSTRNLSITPFVYDAKTGDNITDSSKITIYYNGKWVNLFSVPYEELKSGTVWKIRIESEGYEKEDFSLLIDWYQDRLFISSELQPKAK